jgi:hypothetical protein
MNIFKAIAILPYVEPQFSWPNYQALWGFQDSKYFGLCHRVDHFVGAIFWKNVLPPSLGKILGSFETSVTTVKSTWYHSQESLAF